MQQWLQLPKKMLTRASAVPTKIGSFEVFTTYFLAQLTQFIQLESFELHEFGPGKLEQAVANGTIDIGITYVPIPQPQVEFTEAAKIKMGVFGLKKFKNKSWSELFFAAPLQPLEGTPSKVIGLDGWPDHKHPRQIKYQVTMMESALQMCRLGLCAAYLPEFIVELHNKYVLPEFKLIEQDSPVSQKDRLQSVFLIRRKQTSEISLHKQIAKCLRSLT